MKRILLLFGLLFFIAFGIVAGQNFLRKNSIFPINKTPTITINGQTFKLKLAQSPKEKEIGLSETNSLPENNGMLFIFETPGLYPFWMKNMKIPIDIIYINSDEIITIVSSAQPPVNQNEDLIIYNPEKPSDKVLEINAGLSEKYNFKKGDKVKIENF